MSIQEYAAARGISTQAVYKRLKRAGIALDAIKDQSTGELSAKGKTLLDGIFNPNSVQVDNSTTVYNSVDNQQLAADLAEAQQRLAVMGAELAAKEEQIRTLEGVIADLRGRLDRMQTTADAAQIGAAPLVAEDKKIRPARRWPSPGNQSPAFNLS